MTDWGSRRYLVQFPPLPSLCHHISLASSFLIRHCQYEMQLTHWQRYRSLFNTVPKIDPFRTSVLTVALFLAASNADASNSIFFPSKVPSTMLFFAEAVCALALAEPSQLVIFPSRIAFMLAFALSPSLFKEDDERWISFPSAWRKILSANALSRNDSVKIRVPADRSGLCFCAPDVRLQARYISLGI